MVLVLQIMSGLLLTLNYTNTTAEAFSSIMGLLSNYSYGFLVHSLHVNGANLFFVVLFLHMLKGLLYKSYLLTGVWFSGVVLMLISMCVAFLGYVLPYSNMRLWAATVITNLLTAIPVVGVSLVVWF